MLLAYHTEGIHEAGIDEVGRGCLAGPVVAAAVVLPPNAPAQLPTLNDSKKMSAKQREQCAVQIRACALAYGIGQASVEEIDQHNILQATFMAMHRALGQLSFMPEQLLVDGNRFASYKKLPHVCVIKGDATYLSIAAASVLAKTYRDALMRQLATAYPHYGWERNAGYPTAQHRAALAQHGTTPHHRHSFRLLPEPTINFP